jgi:hypothetical protein
VGNRPTTSVSTTSPIQSGWATERATERVSPQLRCRDQTNKSSHSHTGRASQYPTQCSKTQATVKLVGHLREQEHASLPTHTGRETERMSPQLRCRDQTKNSSHSQTGRASEHPTQCSKPQATVKLVGHLRKQEHAMWELCTDNGQWEPRSQAVKAYNAGIPTAIICFRHNNHKPPQMQKILCRVSCLAQLLSEEDEILGTLAAAWLSLRHGETLDQFVMN